MNTSPHLPGQSKIKVQLRGACNLNYSRLVFFLTLILHSSFGWTSKPSTNVNIQRRHFLLKTIETTASACIVGMITTSSNPKKAWSRNLPESNGADLSATGTLVKLIPLVQMRQSLANAQIILNSSLEEESKENSNSDSIPVGGKLKAFSNAINDIPSNEKQFKKIFDEYSDPVSYKQKYMDSNAFLVYYTNGFDGPGRDSIEKDIPRQTLQYGARNDVWNAFEELMTEIKFADSNSSKKDFEIPLSKAIGSLDMYLGYAPKEDVEKAKLQLMKNL